MTDYESASRGIPGRYGRVPFEYLQHMTLNEIRVYTILSGHQGNAECCYPGQELIAELAGITPRKVRTAVAGLVSKGFVTKRRRPNNSNLYACLFPYENPDRPKTGLMDRPKLGLTDRPKTGLLKEKVKEQRKEKGTHPDRSRIIDTIHQAHLTAYGTKPLWTKRDLAQLDQLVEILEHPLAEIQARSKNWLAWHRLYKETNGKKGRWQADTALTGRTIGTLWDRIAEPPEPGGTSNGDLLQAKHKTIRQESW